MEIIRRPPIIRSPRQWVRPLLGFLLAPLLPPLLYLGAANVFGWFSSFDLAILAAEASYLAAGLGGLPLHIALGKLGWTSLHDYMALGAPLGAVSVLIGERAPVEMIVLFQALLAAFAGALSAGVFWLIARPDRRIG